MEATARDKAPEPPAPPRTRIIACGALARELLAIMKQPGLTHLSLTCLPAIWHNRPERIPDGVRGKIRQARAEGIERILVAYADCGTGGLLDRVLEEEGVERIDGPHCYAFFAGQARFEALADAEIGTFYLTDYLVRHFDRLMWQGLGLDRHPDLRDAYFGHYTKLVYLAQIDDPALDAGAQEAAARLGLSYERISTGMGELAGFVNRAVHHPKQG
ncbi:MULTISPECIES: DUF1638 domain-containing protein [Limibacillus]|jgi:hypothetical protein|uniref:DUF1638 domain-containing protein n=1 Tax=Limibacillus halophilus TaxID=1579333 RepID=A0A839SQ89_9PROT|nr:DUF1638 domain-containing protein [Limibacillus halophilus]MBB3064388.1 hypothetical protein [Limibacillus halophilus]